MQPITSRGTERRQTDRNGPLVKVTGSCLADHPLQAINAGPAALLVLSPTPQITNTSVGLAILVHEGEQCAVSMRVVRVAHEHNGYYVALTCAPLDDRSRHIFDKWFRRPIDTALLRDIYPVKDLASSINLPELSGTRRELLRSARILAALWLVLTSALPIVGHIAGLLVTLQAPVAFVRGFAAVVTVSSVAVGTLLFAKIAVDSRGERLDSLRVRAHCRELGYLLFLLVMVLIGTSILPAVCIWLISLLRF